MSLLGILQAQAPPKQDATSTIQTLCLRLSTSTLLEDRRAAIMGLRSFAREYKETVASGGLRGLIGTLSKDSEDVDTIKVVLETLLLLFVKDESNPESSEDIALWLTDEFTQKQENITVLIELLQDSDFYIRLYALQLLVAILNNRPSRTQECILTAPLGISRLVSVLDDKRDAIRNEGILLIINLSNGHTDIQKLIAFENAFERMFSIIELEGGVEGGIIVQDCLQLLNNLLSFNVSNQSYFREMGCVPRLAKLFQFAQEPVPSYAKEQRDANIEYAMKVCRLFVVPGGLGAAANQNAFFNAGILHLMLVIAFSGFSDFPVRAEALRTVADLIHENSPLQENFAQMKVQYLDPTVLPEVQAQQNNPDDLCYVIEGLLDLALLNSSIHAFDARLAACQCLESYFAGNKPVRLHFLNHAINLHAEGDESANVLTCLINLDQDSRGDPYRVWLASVIFLHLIYNDEEAKNLATSFKEGDADAGEEVVTVIQSISANLVAALEHNYDPRIIIGYLMLLCTWLFEDSPAVDDFLNEASSVQSLVSTVKQPSNSNLLIQGLCAFFLGILYEFSRKDSPLPRATLHPILASRMGRDHYVNKVTKLRENPQVRDFEVFRQTNHRKRKMGLPEVYFDHTFIDFLKDNYSRILRAIDKDPGLETHNTINGIPHALNGISVELVDSLKAQLEDKDEELQKLQTTCLTLEQKITQEQHESQRAKEAAAVEVQKANAATETLRQQHDAELRATTQKTRSEVNELEGRIQRIRWEATEAVRKAKEHGDREIAVLRRRVAESEAVVEKEKMERAGEIQRTKAEAEKAIEQVTLRLHSAEKEALFAHESLRKSEEHARESDQLLRASEALKAANERITSLEEDSRRQKSEATTLLEALTTAQSRLEESTKQQAASEVWIGGLETALAALEASLKKEKSTHAHILHGAQGSAAALEVRVNELEARLRDAEHARKEADEAAKQSSAELDDLFIILGDLEEKRKGDKVFFFLFLALCEIYCGG
ncbi:hypothetical protein C7212DRAFT_217553 [Tuber magnatum]|uniref:Vesicle tethering protein Uso1/P115-like head domain-containing protein n=1 Tax=Tuber magnatum TaxID=42249 RepID=A0A317SJ49_9PEZI|nr:hypothetical protein C7212DRAFT_217553 [Tuber magnatum]